MPHVLEIVFSNHVPSFVQNSISTRHRTAEAQKLLTYPPNIQSASSTQAGEEALFDVSGTAPWRATVSVVLCWSQSSWNVLGVVASSVKELKHNDHCFPFTLAGIQPFRLSPHS
eukprot:COSAG06_NODE_47479_length_339_cov_0.500000_1_plen_113_part_11